MGHLRSSVWNTISPHQEGRNPKIERIRPQPKNWKDGRGLVRISLILVIIYEAVACGMDRMHNIYARLNNC